MLGGMTDLSTVTRAPGRDDRRAGFRRADGRAPPRPAAPRALLAIVLTGQFMAVLDKSRTGFNERALPGIPAR